MIFIAATTIIKGKEGQRGVAIFIRQKIKRQVLTFDNIKGNFDIIGVRIEGEKRNINFICVYRRPGNVERKGT